MSQGPARQVRPIELLRAGWGVLLLAAPRSVLRGIGSPAPDERTVTVTRVLGARQLAQAALSGLSPTPVVLAVGVWVDTVHALTAVGLAATDERRRRTAGADAIVAAGWAVLGRRDLPRVQPDSGGQRSWRDRVGGRLLPLLPGAPSAPVSR